MNWNWTAILNEASLLREMVQLMNDNPDMKKALTEMVVNIYSQLCTMMFYEQLSRESKNHQNELFRQIIMALQKIDKLVVSEFC